MRQTLGDRGHEHFTVHVRDPGRQQKVLQPPDRTAALAAIGEECPLHCPGEGNKEGVQLLSPIGRETPPRAVIEPEKDHRVKLQALALMDRHKGDLAAAFKTIKDIRPNCAIFGAFVQQSPESVADALKIDFTAIPGKSLPQAVRANELQGGVQNLAGCFRIGCAIPHGLTKRAGYFRGLALQSLLSGVVVWV